MEPRKNYHAKNREEASRNAPCPCGSGKKYKKCCLRKEEEIIGLRISINRSIKEKLLSIFNDYFKGDMTKDAFLRRIVTEHPKEDTYVYLYRYVPPTNTDKKEEFELLLVEFKETQIKIEELLRNGKTYEEYKKPPKDSGDQGNSSPE